MRKPVIAPKDFVANMVVVAVVLNFVDGYFSIQLGATGILTGLLRWALALALVLSGSLLFVRKKKAAIASTAILLLGCFVYESWNFIASGALHTEFDRQHVIFAAGLALYAACLVISVVLTLNPRARDQLLSKAAGPK
ncbi:MAG: hypothetical protein JWR07_4183 [Nevskia sp.]|nr:hypothetical protein [Nevskia sp.]